MGDVALHEEARLQAGLVLVAHHDEGRYLQPLGARAPSSKMVFRFIWTPRSMCAEPTGE